MATVSDQNTIRCLLCFNRFKNPRLLPCSHTFCEECLDEYIKKSIQKGSIFMCPMCATPTSPCDSNLAIDKWASAFPLNILINSVLESTENLDKSDSSCEPCNMDGETCMAEYWCAECSEKLCSSCYKSHKRMKQLKHHKIVPIDEMEELKHSYSEFNQVCGHHNERIKLFCVDHRELCCSVCVATNHRQCNDVRSIDDVARDQSHRSSTDFPSIIGDIKKLKSEMEKILTEKKTNAKQAIQEIDKILLEMDNKLDTIIRHLNKLRNEFKNQTEQMYKDTECSMLENEKNVQSFITNIDNSSDILEVIEKNGTLSQKFTTFEHLRSQIMSHYNQLNLSLRDLGEVHFTLKASAPLSDLVETLNSVGSVEISKTSSTTICDVLHGVDKVIKNLNSRSKISTEMCAAQVEKVENVMTSPFTLRKAVKREELGSRTFLTGGTYLDGGRLVMCDYNNKRLVELNDEYNIVKEYNIDFRPIDVAAGNGDNEIYMSVFRDVTLSENYIYKCTLHTDLTILDRIRAPPSTWGIAVSGDNLIVSTTNSVVILTHDGSTVRSIPKSGAYYSYVAVSQAQRAIFHRDKNAVVCRTWEGQEVFRYQHQLLTSPYGMHVDRHRCLYICGKRKVHQVSSSDGKRSRIIRLHSINSPWSIISHSQRNELVVTSDEEDTVCEVYKLG